MKILFNKFCNSPNQLIQFLRFASVGVTISMIDIGLVYLLPYLFGLVVYIARAISLTTALLVGYLLNRYFTFNKEQRGHFFKQLAGHFGVHLSGGLINYSIFAITVHFGHRVFDNPVILGWLPLASLWFGGMMGMLFNYMMSKRFVFQPASSMKAGNLVEGISESAY